MADSYIQDHYKVLKSQYDYLTDVTKSLTDGDRHLFYHVLSSTIIQSREYPDRFIPVPSEVIEKALGRGVSQRNLKRAGLTVLKPFNAETGECYASKVVSDILKEFYRLADFELTSEGAKSYLDAPKVNLFDGKPIAAANPFGIQGPQQK